MGGREGRLGMRHGLTYRVLERGEEANGNGGSLRISENCPVRDVDRRWD
jgi:hypothetical protein